MDASKYGRESFLLCDRQLSTRRDFAMKRVLLLAAFSILLLPGLSACAISGRTITSSPTPARTPGVRASPTGAPTPQSIGAPRINQELERITTQYYTLILARNYAQAYTYLDAHATDANGQAFSLQSFEQMALTRDREAGTIVSFSMRAFSPMVVATVTRSLLGPYHAHLQMKQEGKTWKILSLDRI